MRDVTSGGAAASAGTGDMGNGTFDDVPDGSRVGEGVQNELGRGLLLHRVCGDGVGRVVGFGGGRGQMRLAQDVCDSI